MRSEKEEENEYLRYHSRKIISGFHSVPPAGVRHAQEASLGIKPSTKEDRSQELVKIPDLIHRFQILILILILMLILILILILE